MKTAPAHPKAFPPGRLEVPQPVCEAIARRLSGASRSMSRAAADHARASEVVRVAESLVLAALPKRLDEDRLTDILRLELGDLQDAFSRIRGATPYRAILGLRLEAVRQVLDLYPKLSPPAVARQCGFASFGRFLFEWAVYFGPDTPAPSRPARSSKPVRLKAGAAGRRRSASRQDI